MNKELSKTELVTVKNEIAECMNKIGSSLHGIDMVLAMILVFQLFVGIDYATWINSIISFICYCIGILWLGTYLISAKMIGEKYEIEVFGCIFAFFGAPNPAFALPALHYFFIICSAALPIIEAAIEYRHLGRLTNKSNFTAIRNWKKFSYCNFIVSVVFLIMIFMYFRSYSNISNCDLPASAIILVIFSALSGISIIFTGNKMAKYENVLSNDSQEQI